jgi:hypothetical protein
VEEVRNGIAPLVRCASSRVEPLARDVRKALPLMGYPSDFGGLSNFEGILSISI